MCLISKKTSSKSFKKISSKNIKKKKGFLGKATGHNDHYMINMGGKRPKNGGN